MAPTRPPYRSEAALERACVAYSKTWGCWALKLWPTVAGLPDRLLLYPDGNVRFIEFKQPGRGVSPVQRHVHAQLAGLHHQVLVIDNLRDFKVLVSDWLDR